MKTFIVKLENEVEGFSNKFKKYHFSLLFFLKFSLALIAILLFGGLKTSGYKNGSSTFEDNGIALSQSLKTDILVTRPDEGVSKLINKLVYQFYSDRQFMPGWTVNTEANLQYRELIKLIKSANNYGLLAADYSARELDSLEFQMKTSKIEKRHSLIRAEFEIKATQSAFRLLINLAMGLNPSDSLIAINDYSNGLADYLNYTLRNKKITEGFLAVQPHSKQYVSLQNALQIFVHKVILDTSHFTIKQFQKSDSLVNRTLVNENFLSADSIKNQHAIEIALMKLQKVYNLKQTGKKDDKTLEKLCKSTEDIFMLIALNLDRLRKNNLANDYSILVNIPEFKLYYTGINGHITIYNVVVGKLLTPTPLLTSRMDRIIFNPCWNVPRSITINEILPKMLADSMYLSKHDYSLMDSKGKPVDAAKINWNNLDNHQFNYYIRQQNCDNNALGALKFLFPNQYSVYLHDTPSKKLFNDKSRAYSHGCIRVQYPEKLATQIILEGINSTGTSIDLGKIISSKETFEIKLGEPIPINIGYYTCTTDSLGEINFHDDIYAFDNAAIQKLFSGTLR